MNTFNFRVSMWKLIPKTIWQLNIIYQWYVDANQLLNFLLLNLRALGSLTVYIPFWMFWLLSIFRWQVAHWVGEDIPCEEWNNQRQIPIWGWLEERRSKNNFMYELSGRHRLEDIDNMGKLKKNIPVQKSLKTKKKNVASEKKKLPSPPFLHQ